MEDNNKIGEGSVLFSDGEDKQKDAMDDSKPRGWGTRHTLAILGFFGTALAYAIRINLSIAIVAMTVPLDQLAAQQMSTKDNATVSEVTPTCPGLHEPVGNATNEASKVREGEFEWTAAEQGFILGSFFWGYVATQLLGGVVSTKYGGKWPYGIGILVTAIFALLAPVAARMHRNLLVTVRVIQGLGQGVMFPSMHGILAKWAPAEEKGVMTAIVYAGAQFGTAGALIISGYLIDAKFLGGWPSVFYVFGAITLVWFVFWCLFMYESPEEHPRISNAELSYLRRSLGTKKQSDEDKIPTPWKGIVTSAPAWAIQVAHAGHAWGLYTVLTLMPTYMKTILHFDIKQNSWVSATPYILMWILSLASTSIGDLLIAKGVFPTVVIRKAFQLISQLGPAAALIGAAFSGCDRMLTVSLITAGVGINGAVYGGFIANHAEIAPNHAGVLMGITNTFANFCGFAAPYVAGLLIDGAPSVEKWKMVFYLSAGIYIFNSLFYAIFASATEQPWNKGEKSKTSKADEAPVVRLSSLSKASS